MPRSGWVLVLAIVGLTAFQPIYVSCFAQADGTETQQSPKQVSPPVNLSPIAGEIKSLTRAIESIKPDGKTTDEVDREKNDLQAQQDMAKWARLMYAVTAITTALTGVGVILLGFTLHFTKRAAIAGDQMVREAVATTKAAEASVAETRKATELSQAMVAASETTAKHQLRAYVAVVKVEILETDTGNMPNIFVKAKNFGQTPAYNLVHRQDYRFLGRKAPFDCEVSPQRTGKMDLAPSQEMTRGTLIPVATWTANKSLLETNLGADPNAVDLYVFGEITYDTAFEKQLVTRYRFKFEADDDGVVDGEVFWLCHEGNEAT